MKLHLVLFTILLIGLGVLLGTCRERDKKGRILDNATSGSIRIAVDESLRPLFEAELDTFNGTYKYASVKASYVSEGEAVDALLKDSVRLAVITRKLTPEEANVLIRLNLFPHQTKVAKDAIALILNKTNPDSTLQFAQLKAIMEGKVTQWKELNSKSKLGPFEVVFDHPQSGIIRFLKDSVANVVKLPGDFYAVKSNKAVVEYVSKKPNAIGLIGVSWISDKDDATASEFLKTIRVASLSRDSDAVQPYQAYIANREYPLRRDIFIISREARSGLGTGFSAFVAGDKGQRIVLKSGMVPATMPVRIVVVNKNKFP